MKSYNNLNLIDIIENRSGIVFKAISFSMLLFTTTIFNAQGAHKAPNDTTLDHTSTVSDLRAEFRHGQVFIMWDEAGDNDQDLRVYISRQPINSHNLSNAQLLTEQLEPHSANDWYDDPDECTHTKGPTHGWIIQANHQPMDRKGGLFVHTVLAKDPRLAYFAVLQSNENAGMLKTGVNSLKIPIAISVGQLQAIWQLQGTPPLATGKPLAVYLHSHLARPTGDLTYLFFGDSHMGWREGLPFKFKVSVGPDAVLLEPYDRVWINRKMSVEEAKPNGTYDAQYKNIESWWYGTNSKINSATLHSKGIPTNYTERWILWAMDWIKQNYGTNPYKVYAFGASMGTGIFRMVLQNPGTFASVDLLVPILDPFDEGNVGARMAPRVGDPQSICSDGMKLTDRLNTIKTIRESKTDLPPLIVRMGRSDHSVFWTLKPQLINTIQKQKQAIFAGWDNGEHKTAMRSPLEGFPDWFDFKWYASHFALNMSYPVFTSCSLDNHPGNGEPNVGDTTGFINRGWDWRVISDAKSDYKILLNLKLSKVSYPIYVNVTPRHYQQFKPINNATIYAYNIGVDGKIIEEKMLKADKNGLITYNKFAVTSANGNTLLLKKYKRK